MGRTCEKCGGKCSPFVARKRDAHGRLLCASCSAGAKPQEGVEGFLVLADHTWAENPAGDLLLPPGRYKVAAINGDGTWVDHEGQRALLTPHEAGYVPMDESWRQRKKEEDERARRVWVEREAERGGRSTDGQVEIEGPAGDGVYATEKVNTNNWAFDHEAGELRAVSGYPWYFFPSGDDVAYDGVEDTMEKAKFKVEQLVSGRARYVEGARTTRKLAWENDDCPTCGGSGRIMNGSMDEPCSDCRGTGKADWPRRGSSKRRQAAWDPAWDEEPIHAYKQKAQGYPDERCARCGNLSPVGTPLVVVRKGGGDEGSPWTYESFHPSCFREQYGDDVEIHTTASRKTAGEELVAVDDLKEGDLLASGSTVLGYLSLVRGGAQYAVRRSDGTEGTVVFDRRRKVQVTREGARKHAHDSGDGATVFHCPFCGSGNVIGRGDGTIECDYCHNNFTVQVQPQHPNMPQTNPATGEPLDIPGMPGEIQRGEPGQPDPADPNAAPGAPVPGGRPPAGGAPVADGAAPTAPGRPPAPGAAPGGRPPAGGDKPKPKGADNPFAKKTYRIASGEVLDEDAYLRHLALAHARPDQYGSVLAKVRAENNGG